MVKNIDKIKTKTINALIFLLMCVAIVSCKDTEEIVPSSGDITAPSIISMSFMVAQNPNQLKKNVESEIVSDSLIVFWINGTAVKKKLIPSIEYVGDAIYVGSIQVVSGETKLDFSSPLVMTVVKDSIRKDYIVNVNSYTGIPVVTIDTEGNRNITSKTDYLVASFKLEDPDKRSVVEANVNIKGRGNSTWSFFPKKSYRLKFEEKVSLLDEPKDKSWVMLANYSDKTMLRNQTAFYMGSISNLDYTPRLHFVELVLNGDFRGNYLLGDKLKIGKNRVNVGNDGFLLEIDARATDDEITFKTQHISNPFIIKDPDVVIGDDNYNYVRNYVLMAENALYSDNFTDEKEGWQKYIDMESFVDWYLINEIAKNTDAVFYSSCYMNLKRNGKLKMGPLWDFDIAFGNVNYNDNYLTSGFKIRYTSWFSRLFKDPAFVKRVKERFNYFYSHKNDIMHYIDENAHYLRYSVKENNNRWDILDKYVWPNYVVLGDYTEEVNYLKSWIDERMEWLKGEFDKM